MKTLFGFLTLLLIAPFALWHCSSGSSDFGYDTLSGVLDNAPVDAGGSILDTDGDGIGDAIDWDGDGTPDEQFDPGDLDDPIDGSTSSGGTSSGGGVDPVDPIRTDNGSCVTTANDQLVSASDNQTITAASLESATSIIVRVSGNSKNVIVNMNGADDLQRIIIHMSGNSNTVRVRNATMEHGFCNQGSGGSNSVVLESSNDANIVDLMSGTGGSNNLDSLFTPDLGLIYNLSGNNQCISFTTDTELLDSSSNDNGHTIYDNDTNVGTCL